MECINRCHTPENIKLARIQLIPKSAPGKFRPLAILHPIYRLFDAILEILLQRHIHTNLLYPQYGFSQHNSILDVNIAMRAHFMRAFEVNPLSNFLYVGIDLSNAFENITHPGITDGLREHGVPSLVINLVKKFISHCYSFVELLGERTFKKTYTRQSPGGLLQPNPIHTRSSLYILARRESLPALLLCR